jgi:putative ABC transport system permease protein
MPDWSKEIKTRLGGLNLEPTREADIAEEISQHLNDKYEELLTQGASAQQAEHTLKQELSAGRLDAQLRSLLPAAPLSLVPGGEERGRNPLAGLWKDLRYATRALRLNPGFSIVAILSLMLGIGANTAIFQLLDAIRLRSLPVEAPQELAIVRLPPEQDRTGSFRGRISLLTNDIWETLRDHQQAFSSMGAWGSSSLNLSQGGEARNAEAMWVSGSFFQTLGLRPAEGRLINPADDQRGCGSPVVVISDSFWQREFGGSPVIGHKISLDRHPSEIVGITPPAFFGMEVGRNFDVALPICAEPIFDPEEPLLTQHYGWWLGAIGRLKPGWTLEKATGQLRGMSPALFHATLPPEYVADDRKHYLEMKLEATPAALGVSYLRRAYESPLYLLLAISGLVLLIACANLANLMLARGASRQREIAVRLALGASRARLLRQLLVDSALLALIGTLLGVGLAQALSRLLISFLSSQDSHWFLDLRPDWRVLGFTAGLAILTCVLFGLMPAIRASRTSPGEAMKATGRSITTSRERFGVRRALVVSQVALSLVLVVGALLFVRTLRNLVTLDAGFQQDHILFTDVDLTPINLPLERRAAFRQELLDRVRAIPGVISAADVVIVPVSGNGWNDTVEIPGVTDVKRRWANFNLVSSGYFKTMSTPFLAGRDFNYSDTVTSTPVAIVTEKFAGKFFAGANPVGKTFSVVQYANKPKKEYQIVGLVKDVKYGDLREDFTPIVFLDETQSPEQPPEAQFVLSSNEPSADIISSVKRVVMGMNPALVMQFSPFRTIIRQGLLRERLMATLSGFFGLLAAILAMIGLYGVISYMVVRRKNEIGIRMALGANRGNILRIIMREAAVLLIIGVAVGTILTLVGVKAANTLVFGLSPRDPVTIVAAIGALAIIALLASFLPAQRAAGIDPMQALRDE